MKMKKKRYTVTFYVPAYKLRTTLYHTKKITKAELPYYIWSRFYSMLCHNATWEWEHQQVKVRIDKEKK